MSFSWLRLLEKIFSSLLWWYTPGVRPLQIYFGCIYYGETSSWSLTWLPAAMDTLPQAVQNPCRTRDLLLGFMGLMPNFFSPHPWLPGTKQQLQRACRYTEGTSKLQPEWDFPFCLYSMLASLVTAHRKDFFAIFQMSDIGNLSPGVPWLESILG